MITIIHHPVSDENKSQYHIPLSYILKHPHCYKFSRLYCVCNYCSITNRCPVILLLLQYTFKFCAFLCLIPKTEFLIVKIEFFQKVLLMQKLMIESSIRRMGIKKTERVNCMNHKPTLPTLHLHQK